VVLGLDQASGARAVAPFAADREFKVKAWKLKTTLTSLTPMNRAPTPRHHLFKRKKACGQSELSELTPEGWLPIPLL